jgi:tRNA G10  N-methylase Trm11
MSSILSQRDLTVGSGKQEYIFVLSYRAASKLEIESLIAYLELDATLKSWDSTSLIVECSRRDAIALINRLGGSYKVAEVLGESFHDSLDKVAVPFEPKFNWTVSGYRCNKDTIEEAVEGLHDLIKSRGVGKSKFLKPTVYSEDPRNPKFVEASELKVTELGERVLSEELSNPGIDLIVHGGVGEDSRPIYAQTIQTLDNDSFDQRDFGRPFQDSTRTISPKLARMLVNLALSPKSQSLLDPFCGLGTILQEALMSNVSVIGVDKDQKVLELTRANLRWLEATYRIPAKNRITIFPYDARRISRARMPRVDAVASEPILLPVFSKNPAVQEARNAIEKARDAYERSLHEFAKVLTRRGARISLITPVIVDASGREVTFELGEFAEGIGLKSWTGREPGSIQYPFRLDSSKKKKIQRNLNVFVLD